MANLTGLVANPAVSPRSQVMTRQGPGWLHGDTRDIDGTAVGRSAGKMER
jgi:hypothetical protein